jgi:anti-sigma factor RsiW
MDCDEIQSLLEPLMSGRLSGDESRRVRRHFASCAGCASRLGPSEWIEVLPALDGAIEPSEDFALRFQSRLQEHRLRQSTGRKAWWETVAAAGWVRQLVAAGALATLVVAGIYLRKYPGDVAARINSYNEFAVAENLPLLKDMDVISNMDLLEDLDTIENLPSSPAPPQGQ